MLSTDDSKKMIGSAPQWYNQMFLIIILFLLDHCTIIFSCSCSPLHGPKGAAETPEIIFRSNTEQ